MHLPVQAKDGMGLGIQPGYCRTWMTGVRWHSSLRDRVTSIMVVSKVVTSILTIIQSLCTLSIRDHSSMVPHPSLLHVMSAFYCLGRVKIKSNGITPSILFWTPTLPSLKVTSLKIDKFFFRWNPFI